MKMKKTQSLKLMLLGLMASVGTSTWAAVGDYFFVGDIVYQETKDNTAQVVGVTSAANESTLTIPTSVDNPFVAGTNLLNVTSIADNWFLEGVWSYTNASGASSSIATSNLTAYKNLTLVLDAAHLTKVNAIALNQLSIKVFTVTANSGLKEIDAHSFQANEVVEDPNALAAVKAAKVKEADENLNGTSPENPVVIKNGTYKVDGSWVPVYKMLRNSTGAVPQKTWYLYTKEVEDAAATETTPAVTHIEAWTFCYTDEDGEFTDATDRKYFQKVDLKEDGCLYAQTGAGYLKVAEPVAEGLTLPEGSKYGSKIEYNDAVTALEAAQAAKEAAQTAYDQAAQALTNVQDPDVVELAALAKALNDAIDAIKTSDATNFAALQDKIHALHPTMAVNDITAWFAAYSLANDYDAFSKLGLNGSEIAHFKPLTTAFINAWKAYYTKKNATQHTSLGFMDSYNFNSYKVDGNFTILNGTVDNGNGIEISDIGLGAIIDRSEDEDAVNENANVLGFFKVKVLTHTPDDNTNLVDGEYYVYLGDEGYAGINDDKFYVLYAIRDDIGTAVGEGDFDPVYVNGGGTVAVKINKTVKPVEIVLIPTNDPDIINSAPYADIEGDMTAADSDELQQDKEDKFNELLEAQKALEAAQDAVADAKTKMDEDQAALDAANAMSTIGYSPVYADGVQNKTLKTVNFNNDLIETIGESAFQECVDAQFFGNVLPANTKTIGKKAFFKTKIAATTIGDKVETIGESAFEETPAVPDFADAKALKSIAANAFKKTNTAVVDLQQSANLATLNGTAFAECGVTELLLAGTKLSAVEAGLVQNLKMEDPYEDDCHSAKYQLTLTKTNLPAAITFIPATMYKNCLNLTDVVIPEKVETIGQSAFQYCLNLPSIEIPASVVTIGQNAFDMFTDFGCDETKVSYIDECERASKTITGTPTTGKLATITLAATDSKLKSIGAYAFQANIFATLDLTKQTNLETIGDYAFAYNPKLAVVDMKYTKVEKLASNTFTNDPLLNQVRFDEEIEELGCGLFATNQITNLNLCETSLKVLPNLFIASGENSEPGPNTTLKSVCLPDGLLEIEDYALAHLWGLEGEVVVPGSVMIMGDGVFYDDKNLTAVTIIDSELCGLPPMTFKSCNMLRTITFVTLNTIDCGFGDKCFESAGIDNTDNDQQRPDVYVGYDSYLALTSADGQPQWQSKFGNLMVYNAPIATAKIGSEYVRPYTSKYGTWVEADGNTGVFSAYQNGEAIILYPAKKSMFKDPLTGETKDYYKIAAYDDDADQTAMYASDWELEFEDNVIYQGNDDNYYIRITEGSEIIYQGIVWWIPRTNSWVYPVFVDGDFTSTQTVPGNYGRNDYIHVDKVRGSYIPEEIVKTIKSRMSFGSHAAYMQNVDLPIELVAKGWEALGCAIIKTTNPGGEIKYLQRTAEREKYESTLDLANQLMVNDNDELASNENHLYYYSQAKIGGVMKAGFVHHNNKSILEILPKGTVCFEKTADNSYARDFMDIVVVSESEATKIGGVTEYVSATSSDAIYNLQGVRVMTPQKGQMYIQGGKKFIQK